MTRVVESVVPEFENFLTWDKVVTKELKGAGRFSEFSKALGRLVPIPSIAIEGELVFELTPSVEALKACIDRFINKLPDPLFFNSDPGADTDLVIMLDSLHFGDQVGILNNPGRCATPGDNQLLIKGFVNNYFK
jgi:hypothetical protein